MTITNDETFRPELDKRSGSICELCGADSKLEAYEIGPITDISSDTSALLCETCSSQISGSEIDVNHWRCLNDSMWSEVPAVQVLSYRLLTRLNNEGWARDLKEQLYLDEDVQTWAEAGIEEEGTAAVLTKDSNGVTLEGGDTVTVTKDLEVKGAGFTAKRGTVVKNISLCTNPEHIEGRVNGTKIVLKTCFLKKS